MGTWTLLHVPVEAVKVPAQLPDVMEKLTKVYPVFVETVGPVADVPYPTSLYVGFKEPAAPIFSVYVTLIFQFTWMVRAPVTELHTPVDAVKVPPQVPDVIE